MLQMGGELTENGQCISTLFSPSCIVVFSGPGETWPLQANTILAANTVV